MDNTQYPITEVDMDIDDHGNMNYNTDGSHNINYQPTMLSDFDVTGFKLAPDGALEYTKEGNDGISPAHIPRCPEEQKEIAKLFGYNPDEEYIEEAPNGAVVEFNEASVPKSCAGDITKLQLSRSKTKIQNGVADIYFDPDGKVRTKKWYQFWK